MAKYADHVKTRANAQSEPIPGSTQIQNEAGGYAWAVNDWTRLDRFLILGNESGSYYASEKKMTIENAQTALRCLQADGPRVVRQIVAISQAGRAPKNDPAVFLLALAAGKGDDVTRKAALDALPDVCRTGYFLFQFLDAVQGFRGWGRGLRRAVGQWYTARTPDELGYQLVKYRQRNGWTHRDALRLAKPAAGAVPVLKWAVGKFDGTEPEHLPQVVQAYLKAEKAERAKDIVQILADTPALPWEAIPSQFLKEASVWEALLPNLPMTALVRLLGRLGSVGVLKPMSDGVRIVRERFANEERIRKARLHPVALLGALSAYKLGRGVKGDLTWEVVGGVCDALDEAFYLAFGNVKPSNQRMVLALDVSGSMGSGTIAGMPGLTPRAGSAAMAMVTARTEPNHAIVGFTAGPSGTYTARDGSISPLAITPRQRLDDVVKTVSNLNFGATDCALPMLWAEANKIQADQFVIYTDNETWAGAIHPAQALVRYRQKTGINATLVVVGMTSNGFTIADPNDAGMLDCVGFDPAVPQIISDFALA